jgi:hypothetical protein
MLSFLSPKKFGVCLIPRLGIEGAQKLNRSCASSVHRKFYIDEENMYKKPKTCPQSPKTEFVIFPSIGNFTCSKKKYYFGGQKGENKPSEPKNGIWGPKSVRLCAGADWPYNEVGKIPRGPFRLGAPRPIGGPSAS